MEGSARDRFRLIYLKSPGSEKSNRDERSSCDSSEIHSGILRHSVSNDHFSRIRLEQAATDLKHPDSRLRVLAVRYLEQVDPQDAMPLLQEALSDSSPEVRATALTILIRFRSPELAASLKKHLKDRHDKVKIAALRGLFQMQEKVDLNLLLQLLSDESPWVRRKLATLLGWTQMEGFLPILVELARDVDCKVRKAALISLAILYPEESEGHLIKAMTDPDPLLREWAKKTLEKRINAWNPQRARPVKGIPTSSHPSP